MKNIYFVINDISMPGGLARVTLNLYKQFFENYSHKYTVKIITASISDQNFDLRYSAINLGLQPLHGLNKYKKLLWYILFSFKVNQYLKASNADIVIGVGTMMNLCLSVFTTKKYKIFASEHAAYGQRGIIASGLRAFLYRRLDKVISLTKADEGKYKKNHNDVVTIPNFTTFFSTNLASNLKSKTILSVGRFTKEKGFDLLFDFIKPFFVTHPDWKIILIGEGFLYSSLINKATALNIEKNIVFKEPTRNIEQEYLASSIYIMASRTEGFPMVLLEAQAFGLPIISFDCPTGPSEIIHNGQDGFLIPMHDNELFLEKLDLLASDHSLRKKMGEQAIHNVKKYHPEKIMRQWEAILDE